MKSKPQTSNRLPTSDFIAIDTETTGPCFKHGCEVFAVSACDCTGKEYYWDAPVNPKNRRPSWTDNQLTEIYDLIFSFKVLVFHNSLFDLKALTKLDPQIGKMLLTKEIHDTMIMSHVIDSSQPKGLKEQALLRLDMLDDDEKALDKCVKHLHFAAKKLDWDYARKGHPHFPGIAQMFHKMDMWLPKAYANSGHFDGPVEECDELDTICYKYARLDAVRTACLYLSFTTSLNREPASLAAYALQRRVIRPLLDMEDHGLHLLPNEFEKERVDYSKQLESLKSSLQRTVRDVHSNFNPDSTHALQDILFYHFEFTAHKTTKTGVSTDKTTLYELAKQENTFQARRFVRTLLKYRAVGTALRYLESYNHFQLNYRIYPNMNIVGTATTRLSSREPNGQNVSKGKELDDQFDEDGNPIIAYSLRRVFGPSKGTKWFAIDYDQLQIRIFAFLSKEQSLIEAILKGFDFHTTVAKGLFEVDEPTKSQRKVAKYVNFGIIFGAGRTKIDLLSGVPGTYDKFTKLFPNVADYITSTISEVRNKGFIRTVSGYPLVVPRNKPYAGVNYRVQGTEGDIVKLALANLYDYIQAHQLPVKIVLQVHDEFLFECPEDYDFPVDTLCQIMEQAGDTFGVPCKAKPEIIITNWAEGKHCERT